jgi:hypothetical protein
MFIAVQPFVPAVAIRIDVAPALNRTAVGTLLAVMLARESRDSTAEEAGDHGSGQNGFRGGEHGCVSSWFFSKRFVAGSNDPCALFKHGPRATPDRRP